MYKSIEIQIGGTLFEITHAIANSSKVHVLGLKNDADNEWMIVDEDNGGTDFTFHPLNYSKVVDALKAEGATEFVLENYDGHGLNLNIIGFKENF